VTRQHEGPNGRFYGWRPSLPDHRDLVSDTTTLTILPEVDPRADMPAVYDQGQLGSCTANAVAGAMEYDMHLDGAPFRGHAPSRLLVYYQERLLEGSLGQGDTGAMGRDGFKALQRYGWVPESEWPYHITKYATDPPPSVWADAKLRLLTKPYKAVTRSETAFKQVLSNRQTIAFGFTVYDSFESSEVAATGVVPMPGPGEQVLGGHEVLLIGYLASDPTHALCRNSWSTGWGLGGYFLMPWAYLLNTGLSSDFRTIVRAA
jgi:C1A family cysteine protease